MQFSIKYFVLFILTVIAVIGISFGSGSLSNFKSLFKPVSVVSKVVVQGDLKGMDGRTNVLVLGTDKRDPNESSVASALTDTIMVISIDSNGANPVIISIPRDLWIEQTKSKVNAIYTLSDNDVEVLEDAVEYVLGIPIHYHLIVGFDVFVDAVDTIGGLDINVKEAFEDYRYPIAGKENVLPETDRYLHISFSRGRQNMNGIKALQYARSRHSTNPNQAGDFARSRRQQEVVVAFKDKILSAETLLDPIKVKELYEVYKKNIRTNISLNDALLFYNKYADLESIDINHILLSNEPRAEDKPGSGMLLSPDPEEREARYNGQYVLIPADRTYDNIRALVRLSLFDY